MTKEKYLQNRKALMEEAQNLINEGKLEEASAKMKEVEALDKQFEEAAKAQANMNALKDKAVVTDITNKSVQVAGAVVIDTLDNKDQAKDQEKIYLNAWAKDMLGQKLTEEEQEIFNSVNESFRMDPRNEAFTHTTGNTGIVIPQTVVDGIWKEVGETYPLWADVRKLYVGGNLSMIKGETSTDAGWYEEEEATEDGKETFGMLNLTGCELSRSITVSWKLKTMAIEAFIPYIQSRLAEKMGAALGYGVASGKGKPGESDTFKPEPKGTITALKSEENTPQVITYGHEDPLTYDKFTIALSKIKSGYLKGASIYADNVTIWSKIANIKDAMGRPYFVADVTAGGVGRILGLTVKEDDSIPEGSILIGNASKGYLANINQAVTLDSEDHKKKRETDYIAYGIVDGDVVTSKAFALIEPEVEEG